MGKAINSSYYSTWIVFSIAVLTVSSGLIAFRPAPPNWNDLVQTPKLYFLGGVLGALYIMSIILVAPKLGIGVTTMLALLGQIFAAMLIDHFGWLGVAVHSIGWMRVIGLILMICGVYMVKRF